MIDIGWLFGTSAAFVDAGFEVTVNHLSGAAEAAPLMLSLVALGAVEVVGRQQI
ncbi:hypothetical protein [Haloarcula amylolytica]|uniref:hypothetical protein n=1 Tax=Haloarcula amylolytica TaxID=396317 RepID=UPI003C743F98